MAMTPRQAAIRAHYQRIEENHADLRQHLAVRLAFHGDEKTIKQWMETLERE